jgi:hypothetical protein
MVSPQKDLSGQSIGRLDIQKEVKLDPGTETTEVFGQVEVIDGAGYVYASDLRLKSIQDLLLTVNPGANGYATTPDLFASKYLINKGRKGNYASIYVWDATADALASGSQYVNFTALGE